MNIFPQKNDKDFEIGNIKEISKTIKISNKKNIDNYFKFSQNQKKQEDKDNNLNINSINELRLPKGFIDISFDNPQNK